MPFNYGCFPQTYRDPQKVGLFRSHLALLARRMSSMRPRGMMILSMCRPFIDSRLQRYGDLGLIWLMRQPRWAFL